MVVPSPFLSSNNTNHHVARTYGGIEVEFLLIFYMPNNTDKQSPPISGPILNKVPTRPFIPDPLYITHCDTSITYTASPNPNSRHHRVLTLSTSTHFTRVHPKPTLYVLPPLTSVPLMAWVNLAISTGIEYILPYITPEAAQPRELKALTPYPLTLPRTSLGCSPNGMD